MKQLISILSATLICTSLFAQKTYTLDKYHSRLSFSTTHFGISHVDGIFKNFNVMFKSQKEDFSDAVVEMTAEVKTIDTQVEKRDEDLRSPDWFNVEKYPQITFKSRTFRKVNAKNYKLEGDITMRGVTKPIVFDVVYNGKIQNPMTKKHSVGFTVTGKLNRKDFVVGTDAFDAVVGNEVEVRSNVEFIIDQNTEMGVR